MKILVVDAYFFPEATSFTHLENDLLCGFIKAGHSVTVICPTPTRGVDKETAKKYSKIKEEHIFDGKVFVKRFFAPTERKNPVLRALRYFWCGIRTRSIAKKVKDGDVVFSNSTPPTQGSIAAKIAKELSKKYKRHVPFIYNLQDVFPDSLVNTGLTKKGSLIWKLGRKIENKTYKGADKIIVISEDFKRNIMEKGVSEEKIEVVYNWVDTEKVKPVLRKDNKLFDEYGLDRDAFTVVYAGNFGNAQGVKVIVDAANLLKDRNDIKFVLFGGGAQFEEIKEYAKSLELDNVTINRLLSGDRVSEVYSMGSVGLITCKKGFGACAFPSKTWNIMACNSYIVAAYDPDSEFTEIIEKSGAGRVVEPENAEKLAEAILYVKGKGITVNGREFVKRYADRSVCVEKYVNVFNEMK